MQSVRRMYTYIVYYTICVCFMFPDGALLLLTRPLQAEGSSPQPPATIDHPSQQQ